MTKTIEQSGAGKWALRYRKGQKRERYGKAETYIRGAKWLADVEVVEDWGCGYCTFRDHLPEGAAYIGLDGSPGYCDHVVDLEEYVSTTPGIFMRHVLEHNVNWRQIITNAVQSFQHRMALVLFLPPKMVDTRHSHVDDFGAGEIPNIHICGKDLVGIFGDTLHHRETFRKETIYYLEKPQS